MRTASLIMCGLIVSSVGVDGLVTQSAHSSARPSLGPPAVRTGAVPAPSRRPATPGPASAPIRLRVPSIGVDTVLQTLGLQTDGTLQAPTEWQEAGWFSEGVHPGDPGPAVIAGHVDSRSGPAVFYRLDALRSGDAIYVLRADHSTLRFVVDDIARYRKDKFPSATVYGPQPLPVLRLITCTGEFDRLAHSYLDNLVVSAHLA